MTTRATDSDPPPSGRRPPWNPSIPATALLLLCLPLVAHALAVAYEWIYFPMVLVEGLLSEGPLRGPYAASILRHTLGFTLELAVAAAMTSWMLVRRGASIRRALADAVLHLLPLALAPALLFTDHLLVRVYVYAFLVALVVAGLAWRLVPPEDPDPRSPTPHRLALAAAIVAAALYITLPWLQHASYWSSVYDLGLFAGSIRSTLHGDGFLFSPQFGCTFMAEHFAPILVLLVPFYAIHEDPMTLQVIMALSMASAGYLVFRVADEILKDGWIALAFCLSYLLLPDVLNAQWHGFKMDLLLPPMALGAVLSLHRGNVRWFVLCLLLMWATKEDTVIQTGFLGVYAAWVHRRRALGIAVVAASIVLGILLLGWVLPAYSIFAAPGEYLRDFYADHYKFSRHFEHLGPTLPKAIGGVLANPLYVLGHLFSEDRLAGILTLLGPLAFLALFGGIGSLLLLLPTLEMLLSNFHYMYGLDLYYSCLPVALAYPAAMLGLARLLRRIERRPGAADRRAVPRTRAAVAGYLLAAVMLLAWLDPDHPLSPVFERPAYLVTPRTRAIDRMVAAIPPEVPVSATGYAAIHLMNRPKPAMVPVAVNDAAYVLIDLHRPAYPVKPAVMIVFTRRLLEDPTWGVEQAAGGAVLLRRGGPRDLVPAALRYLDNPDIEAEDYETSAYSNLGVLDRSASNGAALRVTPADRRGPGYLHHGTGWCFTPGDYEAVFRIAAERPDDVPADRLAVTLDVFDVAGELVGPEPGAGILVERHLRFLDFERLGGWVDVPLHFRAARIGPIDFRVLYHDAGTVSLDVIRVRRTGP